MEYMSNGSLYSVLHSNKPLECPLRLQIATDAAKGLAFLHHENILHRDIKSLNVLLDERYKAKLTDFGLSKVKAETKSHTLATKTNSKDSVGTIQWMAPELFRRNAQFTQKSDIFSLGITFWELASRKIPFSDALDASLIKDWVKDGERETIPQDCPATFGALIQACWEGESTKRPDTNDIITQLKQTLEMLAPQKISNVPSPNPSPFPAPSSPQYLSNLVSEEAPKPLVFSPPPKPQLVPQITKQASPEAVAFFVKLIAEGEQEQAEVLLRKDATLALLPSNVTDLSGRTFKGITGFQYAVWALDWHMWTMILKYLPKEQAVKQIRVMERGSWVSQHRKSSDWLVQNLLDALHAIINLLEKVKYDTTQWQTKVGNAQYLLPIPFINEYCHPDRTFEPCPDFIQSYLPRSRKTDVGDWFTAVYNGGRLGDKFAFIRYSFLGVAAQPVAGKLSCGVDYKACHKLLEIRIQQRDSMIFELNNLRSDSAFLVPDPQHFGNFTSEDFPPVSKFEIHPKPIIKSFKTLEGHTRPVQHLQLLPNGELLSSSFGNILKIWDLKTLSCLKTLNLKEQILCVQILPSGEVVTGSDDSNLRLWDIEKMKCVKTLKGHLKPIEILQLLPSGSLASGSRDNTINIWDLKAKKHLKTLRGHNARVVCLQPLFNDELVSGSGDKTIKVWDLKTGNCLKTLIGHGNIVHSIQILSSGELVSASADMTIKVWDLKTGNCLQTLEGHTGSIYCLRLLPNGTLVSGSADMTLKLWDLKSGNYLQTLEGHTDAVRCLELLPNGRLVSGSFDNNLKIWDLTEFSSSPEPEEKRNYMIRK